MNQHSSTSSSSSYTGHSVLSRAQSLRQSFAESRNSYSSASGCTASGTSRWGHQSTVSTTTSGGGLSSQKSPSPSRATAKNCIGSGVSGNNNKTKPTRPASVNWMTPTSPSLSPRANPSSSGSRPATPTTCSLLDYSSGSSPTRFQQQQQSYQQRDEALVNTPPWRLGTAETLINSKVYINNDHTLLSFFFFFFDVTNEFFEL